MKQIWDSDLIQADKYYILNRTFCQAHELQFDTNCYKSMTQFIWKKSTQLMTSAILYDRLLLMM